MARDMTDYVDVVSASYVPKLKICVTFSDGTRQIVDVGDFIRRHPHPMHDRFLDESKFKKFRVENGNVIWGKSGAMEFSVESLHSGHLL